MPRRDPRLATSTVGEVPGPSDGGSACLGDLVVLHELGYGPRSLHRWGRLPPCSRLGLSAVSSVSSAVMMHVLNPEHLDAKAGVLARIAELLSSNRLEEARAMARSATALQYPPRLAPS